MSIQVIELEELSVSRDEGRPVVSNTMDLIKNVKVKMEVVLGEAELSVGELFDLKDGAVVKLNRDVAAPVDIVLDGKTIGRGTLVVVDDNFGIRIAELYNK